MGGTESRQQLQSSFLALKEKEVPLEDETFWSKFWNLPVVVDYFSVLSLDEVRELKSSSPRNLNNLLKRLVLVLEKNSQRPTEEHNPVFNYLEVVNSLRLLTRLLPPIFEDQNRDLIQQIFWKRDEVPQVDPLKTQDTNGTAKKPKENKPLAVKLLDSLVSLLFYPQFTVSDSGVKKISEKQLFVEDRVDSPFSSLSFDYVWAAGVGVKTTAHNPRAFDTNRTEVMKCLLACFSERIYCFPTELIRGNKWLEYFTSQTSYYSLPLFYSLLNVGCLETSSSGWALTNSLFSPTNKEMTTVALQLLVVLLDYTPQQAFDNPLNRTENGDSELCENLFVHHLLKEVKEDDFKFIYSALERELNNASIATNRSSHHHQELLMLFWKLLQHKKQLLPYLSATVDITKIVTPLLIFIYEGRKDSAQIGLIHISIFTLLILSGERGFGIALSKPLTTKIRFDLPLYNCNHADFLILVFYKIFFDAPKMESIYECLLTIIANISAYIKGLSMITSMKMVKLFSKLASARFLFAAEYHHRYLFLMLETFNNIIQYQYEGNPHVIYAFLRSADLFQKLNNLEFPSSPSLNIEQSCSLEFPPPSPSTPPVAEHTPPPSPSQSISRSGSVAPAGTSTRLTSLTSPSPPPLNSASPKQTPLSKFPVTKEWFDKWKSQLPLLTILRLIDAIAPQLPKLCTGSAEDERQILDYLQKTTLVGLLPVPHPILIRRYQQNPSTNLWFSTYIWGLIYLSPSCLAIFNGTRVKLFVLAAKV